MNAASFVVVKIKNEEFQKFPVSLIWTRILTDTHG